MVNLAFNTPLPATELSAEEVYQELTGQIVNLTSHDILSEADGKLIHRPAREANFRAGIRLINEKLDLGLDKAEMETLTLVYAALSEVPRFSGNPHLEARKGGSTAQHSLNTPLRANLLIGRALEQLGAEETPEAICLRKVTGLALMLHDFGESLGEPGTLEQQSINTSFQKDKPAAERLVMEGILRHAAAAVESGNYAGFYTRLDEMKIPDIGDHAQIDSNEEFLARVQERLGKMPVLNEASESRVAVFCQFWDMQEKAGNIPDCLKDTKLNSEFIRNLAALSEHVQTNGFYLTQVEKEGNEANPSGVVPWSLVRSRYQLSNFGYNEGEIGHLFAAAKTPLEKAIAVEAKKEAYEKSIEFLKLGPVAVDRDKKRSEGELAPNHPDRPAEITELLRKSEEEGAKLESEGRGHEPRGIETRERLIAMYEWALANDDFIPAPGQILIATPPAEYRFNETPQKSFAAKVATERTLPQKAAGLI